MHRVRPAATAAHSRPHRLRALPPTRRRVLNTTEGTGADTGPMTDDTRPPADMEYKGAATLLAPRPGVTPPATSTVAPEGIVELIAAITGIADDVSDIINPGAFRRTLRERRPKVCANHRWDAPIGRVLDIKELLPGDPRLPRTTGDGRAWPRAAGALVATAQLNMSTKAGREAFEVIKFFGPAESAFSIGYKVTPGGASHRGGIRYITDLDLYEISAVLHGANRYATLLSVKGTAPVLETKSTAGAVAPQRRAGMPVASLVRKEETQKDARTDRATADWRFSV